MSERTLQVAIDAFPQLIDKFFTMTIPLTAASFALALIISVITAMIQYAHIRGLQRLCRVYIWIVRCTPLLVQLYVVYYGLPGAGIYVDAVPAVIVVFGFNEGAYMAETVRAALEAVPSGQMEAGYCVGLSYLNVMRQIVLPQAFRTAFPSLFNSLISMVKETSLASTITVVEMVRQAKMINGRVYETLGLYLELALIYLAFCSLLTVLQRQGEKRLSKYGGIK